MYQKLMLLVVNTLLLVIKIIIILLPLKMNTLTFLCKLLIVDYYSMH